MHCIFYGEAITFYGVFDIEKSVRKIKCWRKLRKTTFGSIGWYDLHIHTNCNEILEWSDFFFAFSHEAHTLSFDLIYDLITYDFVYLIFV